MAVAGGAASSIRLYIEDGQLVEWGRLYRLQDALVHDVEEAASRLMAGEEIALKTLGPNLIHLRSRLQAQGVTVRDPAESSYKLYRE